MFKTPLLFVCVLLSGITGCDWAERFYISTHWTRGTWTGSDCTIVMITRADPPDEVRATAFHIESGSAWSRPSHPRQNQIDVIGWNAVLTDEHNVLLDPSAYPDGSQLRVRGLMRTAAAAIDKQGRPLHTPDDLERKFGVFVIEVREVSVVRKAPPTTQPVMVYTTVPRPPPKGTMHLLARRVVNSARGSENESESRPPSRQPAMKLSAKAVSSTRIDLRWTAIPGAVEYRVELSHDGEEFFDSATLDASDTWAANEDLEPGKEHFFRVVALGPDEKVLLMSNVATAKTHATASTQANGGR